MKNKLALLNILLPVLMLGILLVSKLSENIIIIITLTIFVGWVIPYFICLITGIIMFHNSHQRLGFIANNLSIILILILITFCIRLFDKKIIVLLVEYCILFFLSIANIVYYRFYLKKNPSKSKIESKAIKEKKKENNGAIV